MNKHTLVLLFSSLSFLVASAADKMQPIITATPSQIITPDARAGGMGDVGAATGADANSQYWNPAKYVFAEKQSGISLSYTPWMKKLVDDINLLYLAGYYKMGDNQSVSASLRYFSLGDVNVTNADGSDAGTTNPFEMSLDLAYGRKLSQHWSAAVALRYIRVDFGSVENMYPGNAFAADVATSYVMPVNLGSQDGTLAFGLNFSNIGTKISYDEGNTNYYLPANMRLGVGFTYPIDEYNKISAYIDANKLMVPSTYYDYADSIGTSKVNLAGSESSESVVSGIFSSFTDGGFSEELKEIAWAGGLEYSYNNQFFLRTGYFYENETKGNRKFWTFGAGFKLNMLGFDVSYSLASQTNPLDQTLRFSLMLDVDGIRDLLNN